MIALLNLLIFLALFIFVLFTNYRVVQQVGRKFEIEANILIVSFIIGVNGFFFSNLARFYIDGLQSSVLRPLIKVGDASLCMLVFLSFAFGAIALAREIDSKKLRTLLRLPLIGLLLGVYLESKHAFLVCLVVEVLIFLFLMTKRAEQNYIFRQQAKSLIGIALFFFLGSTQFMPLAFAGILLFLLMKLQIINAVKLKLTLGNYA